MEISADHLRITRTNSKSNTINNIYIKLIPQSAQWADREVLVSTKKIHKIPKISAENLLLYKNDIFSITECENVKSGGYVHTHT